MSRKARYYGGRGGLYAAVLLFTLFSALPFYVMLITTFKTQSDIFSPANNPFWFTEAPTVANIEQLFLHTQFTQWLLNTALVGLAVVAITLVLAVPAAYGLARLAGRWGESLGIGIFLSYLVPPTLLFIPFSKVIALLGLQNSLWALVLAYPTFTIPFCTWLLMGFFKGIPVDIEEQAMIDGHGRLGAFLHVILPLAMPGLLTVVVFAFTLSTSEFIYALAFVTSSASKTISVAVPTDLIRGDVYHWGPLLAGALIASIPVAVLYTFFIDQLVAGLTAVARK
ncbi:carbohydrate ABC transporter permease [Allopusillimonas soli]|uniref:Carbohydrate ABC transporter permease n=1 Tax=Allopusillimonas soli TaxID=659016 RepID=A0A853FAJ6_9BURK|nr:carbohydrate ABC transporter permease [Allopusillimonas soli]NYT35950.1 carbohydrate ABC transporter permease [Allopusillimonas soli]TEA76299.1 carbohydrate ABC transporter permease [Allopusillimonas soli]